MGVIRKIWGRWIKIAEIIGTVQMIVILSIIYWVFMPLMAIPFKLRADPLALRNRRNAFGPFLERR